MLQVYKQQGDTVTVSWASRDLKATIMDWDGKVFNRFRYQDLVLKPGKTVDDIRDILAEGKLLRKISHSPIGDMILEEDGTPYLDEFGYKVYRKQWISLEGQDIDDRYDGTHYRTDQIFDYAKTETKTVLLRTV